MPDFVVVVPAAASGDSTMGPEIETDCCVTVDSKEGFSGNTTGGEVDGEGDGARLEREAGLRGEEIITLAGSTALEL